ncbi:hypothetical protein F383_23348 [Gossypium arboreum]|uniref:Uncharacterized protein n=1 Tax=Gossypium arboreum TaxID=29729 RepID=A0A0B0MTY2_GOSAR|nr:hypothetical protein F383_29242 [Gossypium arboreum]KHG16951.1 hypothetical protein F383_23348 [Gossypium arboreum]
MSQTWSYSSSHIPVLMPCPRHGLTLTHIKADAMSQTWSYTSSHFAMVQPWSFPSIHHES